MTAELLSSVAGVALSLAFSYVPGLKERYAALSPVGKRGIMALLICIVAGGTFGLSCAGILDVVECTDAGAVGLVKLAIAALVANQATFLISPGQKSGLSDADRQLFATEARMSSVRALYDTTGFEEP